MLAKSATQSRYIPELDLTLPPTDLPDEDGWPMEEAWNMFQLHLLIDVVSSLWRDRTDYFASGNIFIYYSTEQAKSVIENRPIYKGPDFFVVKGVDGTKFRKSWIVWEEGGRYPDLIIEFLSPSTARQDKTEKKRLYEQVFRTEEYFWFDPTQHELVGFELHNGHYEQKQPNEHGWLWSEVLGAWLGIWEGEYRQWRFPWLRLYTRDGALVPTSAEAAQMEAEQAQKQLETERRRAERAEAELKRLRELLKQQGIDIRERND
ncbi:MAG: Uma2 family endonuclease [Armatimonadetes bacterium]|nr:Uma2 family endonuclease [Armatimonadota bacterium]CUU35949.1 Endonuclease, Uma2 family (restriction endonuclease fold) [Armatimonadetes bacterium DC]